MESPRTNGAIAHIADADILSFSGISRRRQCRHRVESVPNDTIAEEMFVLVKKMCMEPPLPLEIPVSLPYNSAITAFRSVPNPEWVCVVAVGCDPLVILGEGRDRTGRTGL